MVPPAIPARVLLWIFLVGTSALAHPLRAVFERAAALDEGTLTHLVYADWLDDNGDPDRAAFLRNQVAISSLAPDDPALPALEARGTELFEAHHGTWFPPITGVPGVQMRGGLADIVTAESTELETSIREAYPSVRMIRVVGRDFPVTPRPLFPQELEALDAAMVWMRRRAAGLANAQGILNAAHAQQLCSAILRRLGRVP